MDASLDPVPAAAGEEARPGSGDSGTPSSSLRWSLVMAVHKLDVATSKVPFSMILLLDHIRTRRALPPDDVARCRMVLPSDGLVSVSLWDAADAGALKAWLDENLGSDCINTLCEVQEEFTYGAALELARARGADKVGERAAGARAALGAGIATAHSKLQAWDERTGAVTMARETTAAAAARVSSALHKAAENERVQTAAAAASAAVATGWRKASDMLGWARQRVDAAQAPGSGGSSPMRHQAGDGTMQYGGGSGRLYGSSGGGSGGGSVLGGGGGAAAVAAPDLDLDKQLRLSDDPLEGLDSLGLPTAAPAAQSGWSAAAAGAAAAGGAPAPPPAAVGGGFGTAHAQR